MRFARRLEVGPDLQSVSDIAEKLPSKSRVRKFRGLEGTHWKSKALADRPVLLLVTWLPSPRLMPQLGRGGWSESSRHEAPRSFPGEFEGKLALAQHRLAVASFMPHRAKLLAKQPSDLDPRSVWRKLKSVAGYGITRVTVDIVTASSPAGSSSPSGDLLGHSLAFRVPFGKTVGDLRRAVLVTVTAKQQERGSEGTADGSSTVSSPSSDSRVILYRLNSRRRLPIRPKNVVTLQSGGTLRVDKSEGRAAGARAGGVASGGSAARAHAHVSNDSDAVDFDSELHARQARHAVASEHTGGRSPKEALPAPSLASSRPLTALPPRLAVRSSTDVLQRGRASTGRSTSSVSSGTSASRSLVGSLVDRLSDDSVALEAVVSDGETLLAYLSRRERVSVSYLEVGGTEKESKGSH